MQQEELILNYFSTLKKRRLLSNSYLFVGDNLGLVKDIIKLIICLEREDYFCNSCWDCNRVEENNHPDIFIIEPEPISIKIERIKESQNFIYLKSFRAKYKIVLVKGAEYFSLEAGNAFLKTLEEPPKNSLIILYVDKLDMLLPTINSRCRKIFLPYREKSEEINTKKVIDFFEGFYPKFENRKDFAKFLFSLIFIFHNSLISKFITRSQKNDKILERLNRYDIKETKEILEELLKIYNIYNNINENLALKLISFKLKK